LRQLTHFLPLAKRIGHPVRLNVPQHLGGQGPERQSSSRNINTRSDRGDKAAEFLAGDVHPFGSAIFGQTYSQVMGGQIENFGNREMSQKTGVDDGGEQVADRLSPASISCGC